MALVRKPRLSIDCQSAARLARAAAAPTWGVLLLVGLVGSISAQTPGVHYLQSGDMPPGAIGRWQLTRGGPLPGYFQPVEISAPSGALISLAVDGHFDDPQSGLRLGAMLIGQVYRLKVTGIPLHAGVEVYPTIEMINRLYPPRGREWKFPVPIELTDSELLLAAQGNMVTRIIYLEDPRQALPAEQIGGRQSWFEAAPGDDPLKVADRMGRPMAILRMGGLVPLNGEEEPEFLNGSPPLIVAAPGAPAADPRRRARVESEQVPLPLPQGNHAAPLGPVFDPAPVAPRRIVLPPAVPGPPLAPMPVTPPPPPIPQPPK